MNKSLLNQKNMKAFLLAQARSMGRTNFTRVSKDALTHLEGCLRNSARSYIHSHRSCKTLGEP